MWVFWVFVGGAGQVLVCVYQYVCTSLFWSYDIGPIKSQVLSTGVYVCTYVGVGVGVCTCVCAH